MAEGRAVLPMELCNSMYRERTVDVEFVSRQLKPPPVGFQLCVCVLNIKEASLILQIIEWKKNMMLIAILFCKRS